MAPAQITQLEKIINELLKSGDGQALDRFLQKDTHGASPIKCSQQFLTKLDKLVTRSLDDKDPRSASLGLSVLYKCGKKLKLPGDCQGLPGMIEQGLLKKMEQWFEKCRQLWIQCGPKWDETLFSLSEDFFDALMVVHDACKEGTYKVTEIFLYPVGQLVVDRRIHILIQKEAIRKFNLILDKIPMELKKQRKILTSQEASDIMIKLAGHILEGGDYDLQTALMEALCRMTTPDQRRELAGQWFSMEHMASGFVKISDSEFETDCRKFLNMVNGMQGEGRRVYSYPCLEVYLGKYELLMPTDEKLEEFWIDFNLGSHSISFYFSLPDDEAQEGQWETISITENEVQSYTVTEEGKRLVLQLKLTEVVVVGTVEGSSLTIHFSSSLDIMQAVCRVFGHGKNKGFVGKTGTSVVKTTVKILMEENSSQVVPESQLSLGESEKNTAAYLLPAPSASVQMGTPAKMRISESTTFINSSAGGSVRRASSLSAVMPLSIPAKGKGKPSLEMVRSCDKQGDFYQGEPSTTVKTCSHDTTPNSTIAGGMIAQSNSSVQSTTSQRASKTKNIPLAKAVDMVLAGQGEESLEPSFVPDTQPGTVRNISSSWSKLSVSEMLMLPTQKMNSLPSPASHSSLAQQQEHPSSAQRLSAPVHGPISQKQLHTELTQRLQHVLREADRDAAPQAAAQRKMSYTREDSKGRSSVDRFASTLCSPKGQQAQRNSQANRKIKGQMSPEADAALMKAPAKAKALQEKIPNVKVGTNRALSSKEKRDAEVAGSMVKLISSHYQNTQSNTQSKTKVAAGNKPQSCSPPFVNRPVFNMNWISTGKREESGNVSFMKTNSKTTSSTRQRKDIFAFDSDAPLSIGKNDKILTDTSAISSSGFTDSSVPASTNKKGQPAAKEKRYLKKHLFSDTDTDCAMTEVSWLRESNRKPKPKVTKYSRQAPVKPKVASPHTQSPDLPLPSENSVKCNTKPNKKKPNLKENVEQPKKTVKPVTAPNRPSMRPKRAAAISTKSYKEPDTDDSQSQSEKSPASKYQYSFTNHLDNAEKTQEAAQVTKKKTASEQRIKSNMKPESNSLLDLESVSEMPPTPKKYFIGQQGGNEKTCSEVKKRKNTPSEKFTDTYSRLDSIIQMSDVKKTSGLKQQRPVNVPPETLKLDKKNVVLAQEQMNTLKDFRAARQASVGPSPPFIERMRSAERSAPTLGLTRSSLLTPRGSPLPASPIPLNQDTPSPIPLLPRPHSAVSSIGNYRPSSFYSAEKKHSSSKTQSIQSVTSFPSMTPIRQTPAPDVEAVLTSTQLQLDKPSVPSAPLSPFLEDTINHSCHYSLSKVSSVSLSQSSTKSSILIGRVTGSPTTALAMFHQTEKTPLSDRNLKPAKVLISGPSRKRHISSSSDSEEDEKGEMKKSKKRFQRSPRMKPRKLFKSSTRPHGNAQSSGDQSSVDEEDNKESRPKGRTYKVTKSRISEAFQRSKPDYNRTITDAAHATGIEISAEDEMSQVMSCSRTLSSSHWETEVGDGDMDEEDLQVPKMAVNPSNLYQQFSSELKKKFQNRCNMMEVYNKQSLRTVQQHVSSFNVQVTKYRTQRLKQVEAALLEQIHRLEQSETVLKNMEKDLTMNWKKQTIAFHSYQEQEIRRNETLKEVLQSNTCHSLEYEERIFISQMCLIRKDMKSVQDRLLTHMQEGEIQSVKRGLHSLFFP